MHKEDFSRCYGKSKDLCFDENEFLKESFSVDTFLREHRNKASLEIMRDDLGSHLKTLRLSMIELINKDYEDFVNLSKDLVGLDNEIKKICFPLETIREEVKGVKNDLEETIMGFNDCIEKYNEISDKKKSLIHVTQVITCLEKLKRIFETNKESKKDFTLDLIERAMMEFIQLQFSISKCNKDLADIQQKEAKEIEIKFMTILNNKFLESLKTKNSLAIVKCLKIFVGLDKIQDLESLVRHEVVEPKLKEIINEKILFKEPDGIDQMYNEIFNFIELDLMELLRFTTYGEKLPAVKGYNFVTNSVWPELEKKLDLPLLFAPGNPNLFHLRYKKSVDFIRKLESLCGNQSAVLQLRQNEQYQHFFQKWNLPVYFKIRFQEIAGQLEKVLSEADMSTIKKQEEEEEEDKNSYSLKVSFMIVEQIKKCWIDEIYIPEISHMFWKLSLQIISRFTVWVGSLLLKESEFLEKRKTELTTLQTSTGLENLQVRFKLDYLVCLFSDVNKLLTDIGMFLDKCKEKVPNRHLIEKDLLSSLKESLEMIEKTLPKITDIIVTIIVNESAIHLREVSQIPRLFRRTNRKSSTEPCEYVGLVLNLSKQFYDWKKNSVSETVLEYWLTSIFNELSSQFYSVVNEVLTNAQKTEESLRKLKKKKDSYSAKSSGDEEIRQQLVIDVHSFCNGIETVHVQREKFSKLKELVKLVETARNKSEQQ